MRLLLAILVLVSTSAVAGAACDPGPCPAPVDPGAVLLPGPDLQAPEPLALPPMPAPPMPAEIPIHRPDIRVGPVDDSFGNRMDGQDPVQE